MCSSATANAKTLLDLNCNAFCKSEVIESEEFTFVWEIPKFGSRTGVNGYYILSKEFTIDGPGNKSTKWCGKIYPNGSVSDNKDFTALFLLNNNNEDVIVKCAMMTVDANKKRILDSKQNMHMQEIKAKNSWGFEKFFNRSTEFAKHVPNDTLTIVFDITVAQYVESFQQKNYSNKMESLSKKFHQDQMSQDLGQLFRNNDFADVVITCGNKKFECHRNILTSRSPFFKAMFSSSVKEEKYGRVSVEMKNMDPQVLENLLQYIYTCEAANIDSLTKELFLAAEEYQIEKLKELCEVKLCSNIDADNCIELLVFGDKYKASILKTTALRFVGENMSDIDVEECRKMLISNPSLLFELMNIKFPKKKVSELNQEKKRSDK